MIVSGIFFALGRKPQSFLDLASIMLSELLNPLQDVISKKVMSMCSMFPGSRSDVSMVFPLFLFFPLVSTQMVQWQALLWCLGLTLGRPMSVCCLHIVVIFFSQMWDNLLWSASYERLCANLEKMPLFNVGNGMMDFCSCDEI